MNKNFLCEWNCYMNKFSCMNRISYVNKISYMNKNFLHEWISYMNKFSYMNKISLWITWIKFLIWIHLACMNKKCVHEYCYIWSTIKVYIFESFNFAVEFPTVNPSLFQRKRIDCVRSYFSFGTVLASRCYKTLIEMTNSK